MIKTIILTTLIVLSALTYRYQVLVPLGFVLAVLYLYQVHRILLINKEIIDNNVQDTKRSITSLLNNQKVLLSDVKTLKNDIERHGKKIKRQK